MNLRGLQSGFTSGELSPKMLGQVDFDKYQFGCEVLENMIVWPQGMTSFRPGTRYIATAKSSATAVRLIPFEFSTTQAYIIEAGDEYFRFFKDRGQILDSGSPYEITHPYAAADLFGLNFTQSADILYFAHGSYAPQMLSRTGHTAWTIASVVFVDGPYLDEKTDITLTLSGGTYTVGSTCTLTASADLFDADHVGSFWRIKNGSTWYYVKVTDHTSATEVEVLTMVDCIGGAQSAYREGAWSAYRGYPTMVGFYENRLCWGATAHQPQTLWGSKSGDYYNHIPGADDNDPIVVTLNSDYVNAIKWMSGGKVLLLGTSRGQWHLSPTGTDSALSPSNIKAAQETGLTSSAIFAKSDHAVLFWQHFGRHLMEVAYSLASDSYQATPLTIMAEHIAQSPIKEMAYIQEPMGAVFCVRQDGEIAVLTYERQHKVVAWTRWTTTGLFESVAKIPGTDRDELWVLVNRTVGGYTKRFIELVEDLEIYEGEVEDLFYVDSGLTYDGVAATTISGLDHLEGCTVAILADGSVQADQVVVSGDITLPAAAEKVQAGLSYQGIIKPVRPELKVQGGTLQNRRQRVVTVGIRYYRSYGSMVGETMAKLEVIPFKVMGDPMGEALTLFTGDKRAQFSGSLNRDGQMYLVQTMPLPMNVLALMPRIVVE